MFKMYAEDKLYIDTIHAKSAIFTSRDEVVDEVDIYANYITSKEFIDYLLLILENNKEMEFFDSGIKHNILKILSYIRDFIKLNPDAVENHFDLVNDCIRLINSTPGERGVPKFYKTEYIKRNSDIISPRFIKAPILFSETYRYKEKEEVEESIMFEWDVISKLLFADEDRFLNHDTLFFLLKANFLDALNITLCDNPGLYNYFDFKARAIHVLVSNLKLAAGQSKIYDILDKTSITDRIVSRTNNTLKRIRKMK